MLKVTILIKDIVDFTPYCRQREKPVSLEKGKLVWERTKRERDMNGNSRKMP